RFSKNGLEQVRRWSSEVLEQWIKVVPLIIRQHSNSSCTPTLTASVSGQDTDLSRHKKMAGRSDYLIRRTHVAKS
ncbi:MAG: hypothetical protein PVJ22_16830, partial [Desulfobacterales bacterium]